MFSIKLIKIFLINFLLIIESMRCLNPNKFCFLRNSNETKCTKKQCDQDICSSNNELCSKLLNWSSILAKYKGYSFYQKKHFVFQVFLAKVKYCRPNEYITIRSEICLKNELCESKKNWLSLFFFRSPTEKICTCGGKFKIDCGNKYCSKKQSSCDLIFKNKSYFNKTNKCY